MTWFGYGAVCDVTLACGMQTGGFHPGNVHVEVF